MATIFRGYRVSTWLRHRPGKSPDVSACIGDSMEERVSLRVYHIEAESERAAKKKARAMRKRDDRSM